MASKRRIAIIGSTGSIGTQALDVVRAHRDLFEVELLTANKNASLLASQALEFEANTAVICSEDSYPELKAALEGSYVKAFAGMDSVCELVRSEDIDMVLTATVGFSGLRPTLSAIEAGKAIALANKETLVAAGDIVIPLAKQKGVPILPVDSEHSAIFQCLLGAGSNKVSKIHLTASGGPFRTLPKEGITRMKASDALKHPKWSMGAKITIDSATMMNKGFEMIEAHHLFDLDAEQIHILVHPESVVHSMVEFEDGAVLAQMARPDMRQPIAFALAFPERLPLGIQGPDFAALSALHFEEPDLDKFPCIGLAFDALSQGGLVPCAMNAANEVAVEAFRQDRIGFYDIPKIIENTMAAAPRVAKPCIDDIFDCDVWCRAKAIEML